MQRRATTVLQLPSRTPLCAITQRKDTIATATALLMKTVMAYAINLKRLVVQMKTLATTMRMPPIQTIRVTLAATVA
jgi:hypothetical protein